MLKGRVAEPGMEARKRHVALVYCVTSPGVPLSGTWENAVASFTGPVDCVFPEIQ